MVLPTHVLNAEEWMYTSSQTILPAYADLWEMTRKDRDRFYTLVSEERPLIDRIVEVERLMSICVSYDSLEIYFAQHSHLQMFCLTNDQNGCSYCKSMDWPICMLNKL